MAKRDYYDILGLAAGYWHTTSVESVTSATIDKTISMNAVTGLTSGMEAVTGLTSGMEAVTGLTSGMEATTGLTAGMNTLSVSVSLNG